ncbi:hypothetical protein FRC12_015992 [Ceratobasidium sp. 428]|nr:hypothetical protein FRC12_015992 [Ceratobasidium sp. 428]
MPPQQFFVRLQHGITGGFAPPTPSAIHQLSRSSDEPANIFIQSMVRPDGEASLSDLGPKQLPVDDHAHLVEELHSILKQLPTESPPGSEDIYGLDTSIAWGSDDLEWINGGPQGCGGGTSDVQATSEQKEKFKRAVEIVTELTKKDA